MISLLLALLITLGLFIAAPYIVYKPPAFLIRYFQHRWPDVLWQVSTSRKAIALTIDDGPSEYTNEILEVLEANDARATFFIIGSQSDGHEKTLRDIIRGNNELGNHAMHDEPSRSLNNVELTKQVGLVEEKINEAYNLVQVDPPQKYFRPGSGFFSTRMRKTMADLGYWLVLGNIYPHDPQIPFWRVNANHILSMLQPGGIIICHDRRSWTVPMLREVLPEIKRRGYRVVTVTELLKEAKA